MAIEYDLRVQARALEPGGMFGRSYRVIGPLAEGGMGAVYQVEHVMTGARRALKVLHPSVASDPGARALFEREARVGASIASAHVVEVLDAGVDDASGTPFLVMELLQGHGLAEYVGARGGLAASEAWTVLSQLGDALGAAHRARIVHRDVKPENVWISPGRHGTPLTVKVLDFGLAKMLERANTLATATGPMGTPFWMAPEQLDARGRIGLPTDVWAFGLVAFFVLSGKKYWLAANLPEASIASVVTEIVIDAIEPASERLAQLGGDRARLPAGFDRWFSRCLNRDARSRFADAAEATAALAVVFAGGARDAATSLGMSPTLRGASVPAGASRSERAGVLRPRGALALAAIPVVLLAGAWLARSKAAARRASELAALRGVPAAGGGVHDSMGLDSTDAAPTTVGAAPARDRDTMALAASAVGAPAAGPRLAGGTGDLARSTSADAGAPVTTRASVAPCAGVWRGRLVHALYGNVAVTANVVPGSHLCGSVSEDWSYQGGQRCRYRLSGCRLGRDLLTGSLVLRPGSHSGCEPVRLSLRCGEGRAEYATVGATYTLRGSLTRSAAPR